VHGAPGTQPSLVLRRPADLGVAGAETARQFSDAVARASAERHDAILATVDHGIAADGVPYSLVEWCPGEPLSRLLSRERALGQRTALAIFADVARGLAELQRRLPCLRRADPRAIWIATGPNGLGARAIDAGLAVVPVALPDEERVTVPGETPESCGFMSPEEARGEPVDPVRAASWGLGVLLYRMLLGALPFVARSRAQLAKLTSRGLRSPRSLDQTIDLAVSDLVCACLARKPGFRPPSDVLAARAEAILGRLPVRTADRVVLERALVAAKPSNEPERVVMEDLSLEIEIDESSCRGGAPNELDVDLELDASDGFEVLRESEAPTARFAPHGGSEPFSLGGPRPDLDSTTSFAPIESTSGPRRRAIARGAALVAIGVAVVAGMVAIGAHAQGPTRLAPQAANVAALAEVAPAAAPAPLVETTPAAPAAQPPPAVAPTLAPAPLPASPSAAPVVVSPTPPDEAVVPPAASSVAPAAPTASVAPPRSAARPTLDDAWSAAPTASSQPGVPIAPAAPVAPAVPGTPAAPAEPSVATAGN
jgi:serine/threonine protein kinase